MRYSELLNAVLSDSSVLTNVFLAALFAILAWICRTVALSQATSYSFRQARIHITSGVFNRSEILIELFRIDKMTIEQTFINQVTGDATLVIDTKDLPPIRLTGLAKNHELSKIRDQLRDVRDRLRAGPWMRMGIIN
jgi:uncharacterized membrane protein YdbT with pleckstrin-like domain